MICGVLCLDDQDGLMIAAMFLNLLKAGLVCSGRLVPCVPTAVAGSKTGFQHQRLSIMFRVRDFDVLAG